MIERILVATDLSAAADRAMERAQLLAIQSDAEIACVMALEPVAGRPRFDLAGREEEVRRHFHATMLGLQLKPLIAVAPGPADRVMMEFAELWRPDLIVVGEGGERIALAVSCPVLIVRNRALRPYRVCLADVISSRVDGDDGEVVAVQRPRLQNAVTGADMLVLP